MGDFAGVAEIRGVSQQVASADLIRYVRWGLLSRSPSRPYQYAVTKRRKQRLDWFCDPRPTGHKPNQFAKPGKLEYRQFVRLIYEGSRTTTDIARSLEIPVKHAAASATRVWKMGLLHRTQSGRQFLYSLTAKGLHLVEGTAPFSVDVMQFAENGHVHLERGAIALGTRSS